jgi:hypothetical protein
MHFIFKNLKVLYLELYRRASVFPLGLSCSSRGEMLCFSRAIFSKRNLPGGFYASAGNIQTVHLCTVMSRGNKERLNILQV